MYFLAQMEIGDDARITLGIVHSHTEKMANDVLIRFLRREGFDPVIEHDGTITLAEGATVTIIRLFALTRHTEAIDLAKKFLNKE